jgi:hypothetical protein
MRYWLALVMLTWLAVSGCAQSSGASNDDNHDRFGGLYGGVSGGVEP